jgi:triosephosphate isomerase
VGNWKMHGSSNSIEALVPALAAAAGSQTEVVVCPVSVHIPLALQLAEGSGLEIGAQNCSEHEQGAYTGEVAAAMLAEAGCKWVILGHSERRQYYRETDALVAAKSIAARAAGLTPILCVGETLEQRQQGQAEAVVTAQLAALVEVGLEETDVIAYEPVWAIGTGQTASPAQAQEMHACIRAFLQENVAEKASAIRLLYGGSVKGESARELFAQEDIDGGLVGGASLKAEEFTAIIEGSQD